MTTFLLNSLRSASALSQARLGRRVVGALLELVGVAAERRDPARHEGDARHAALDAVVAELLRVLLHPFDELGVGLRRVLHEVGVVGDRGLAVEHRHDVADDLRAERVLRGVAGHELAGRDLVGVFLEQALLHHRAGGLLVDDDDVEVGLRGAALLLRVELLVDLLRAGVARAGADRDHLHAGMRLLEHRAEIVLDVVDHVLVAGGRDVERLLRRRPAHASARRGKGRVRCVLRMSSSLVAWRLGTGAAPPAASADRLGCRGRGSARPSR